MRFPTPLIRGTLLKRYKRFLADIRLDSGEEVTAHCPNTGTMLSCSTPGSPVCLSISDNPKRKYQHTLEMVKSGNFWVGVNTAKTNSLVREAIEQGNIEEFKDYPEIRNEVKTSSHTRLDLKLSNSQHSVYIEVKNCSLAENGIAMFPDAVTLRGTKHLLELQRLQKLGKKTCIFFLVQREDANRFSPATHIDKTYSETLKKVADAGVMVLAYQAEVNPSKIEICHRLTVEL